MESLLIAINIGLAVILVISVLLQKSEGGALGLGVSQDNFTSTRTIGSFLTKFTSIIAALFIICSILLLLFLVMNFVKHNQFSRNKKKRIQTFHKFLNQNKFNTLIIKDF